jgi:hypothetical protein
MPGMNEFGVPATDEAIAYIRQIADEMATLFGLDPAEAQGRIRHFWTGEAFLTEYALLALFHRTTQSWAKQIYYGGRPWWRDGPPPEPEPYPPV